MTGASIINIAVLHSAAAIATIPLCAALACLAWNRRAQIRELATALRDNHRTGPPATPPRRNTDTRVIMSDPPNQKHS